MNDLKGKICWVTGASSGIGEGLVKKLKKQEAKVILSARRKDELIRVQKDAGFSDADCLILEMDLTNPDSFDSKYKLVLNKFGKVDVLFNNGGISQRSLVRDTELSVYKKIFDVNFFGNIALSKTVLPDMLARKSGAIVVISSIVGKVGTQLRSGYSASKHALHGFYDALRLEVSDENVQILTILPGYIKTNVSINAVTGAGDKYGKMDDAQENGMPPEECAAKIIQALKNNESEVIIAGFKENLAVALKRFAPDLLTHVLKNSKVT